MVAARVASILIRTIAALTGIFPRVKSVQQKHELISEVGQLVREILPNPHRDY